MAITASAHAASASAYSTYKSRVAQMRKSYRGVRSSSYFVSSGIDNPDLMRKGRGSTVPNVSLATGKQVWLLAPFSLLLACNRIGCPTLTLDETPWQSCQVPAREHVDIDEACMRRPT
ncbi:hypothetical protein MN608_04479 [Microdochium nivale]|nr:hypothetical protein MN608_04479 [Microdochium nivale]